MTRLVQKENFLVQNSIFAQLPNSYLIATQGLPYSYLTASLQLPNCKKKSAAHKNGF